MADATHGHAAIRSTVLGSVLDRLIARGVSTQPLLSKHGMSLDILKDPYARLSVMEYAGFMESAAALSGDEHIGARIGSDIRAGDLGPMGILLSLSRSIYVGIDRIVRSTRSLQTGTEVALIENGDDVFWSYRLDDGHIWPSRQDAEFTLVATTQVIRDNFISRWAPQQVHFEHVEPESAQFLRRYFGCPVLYGQATNRLVMDRGPMLEIYRAEDTALVSMLERHIADLIEKTPRRSTLTEATRSIVSSSLGLRPVSVERVAETLGLSSRNLQRKLAEEGTSVRILLDEIRRTRAEMLLQEGTQSVGRIATALGYADGTAFWRAHKRWSEHSPRQVKASGSSL